jgi:DNA-directed RNA polymerase subunit N (RpoN/RPB10)
MVRFDEALKQIFGWKNVASISTYTRFFRKFSRVDVDKVFGNMNRLFFNQIPSRSLTLDLDSSVVTRYGKQEGSLVGYNPNKPGRPSHHPIMAFIADIRMVAHSWLRSGNAGTANGVKNFLDETLDILANHRIGLIRADAGFFDGNFMSHIEGKGLNYIIAARMNPVLKNRINGLTGWIRVDGGIEVHEFSYQAYPWDKERRIVVVRQDVEQRPNAGGKYLFEMKEYRYQAWVTMLTLPPAEVWRLYRQRADSENRIEELKYDFGLNGFCLNDFYATEAAFRMIIMGYNIISLFRQLILKWTAQPRLQTIRFKCFAIGSWIGKKYRKRVLKVSLPVKRRPWFEGLFSKLIDFSPPFRFEANS